MESQLFKMINRIVNKNKKLSKSFNFTYKTQKYKLDELHRHLFGQPVQNPHQSSADSWATYLCYVELMK